MMVLAILLIGLALEEALNLYSLALLEEIEECLVIVGWGLEDLVERGLDSLSFLSDVNGYTRNR